MFPPTLVLHLHLQLLVMFEYLQHLGETTLTTRQCLPLRQARAHLRPHLLAHRVLLRDTRQLLEVVEARLEALQESLPAHRQRAV